VMLCGEKLPTCCRQAAARQKMVGVCCNHKQRHG
jgi:hypothetical protein